MANLKTNYAGIHIPAGCTVSVGETVESLIDLGVIPEETDSNITITYDTTKVQGSKLEQVVNYVRNMTAKGTSALYQVNLENLNKLSGGIMNITKSAGAIVTGDTHVISAPVKQVLYMLPGQNANKAAPTITKVMRGSTEIAADTGYVLSKDSAGNWGIMFLTITGTTDITITYSYTPAAYTKATMGDAALSINPKVVRFEKEVNGKKFSVTLYSAIMTNGLSLSFPAASNENIPSIPIEIEGSLDVSRASGDQLLEIIDEIGA